MVGWYPVIYTKKGGFNMSLDAKKVILKKIIINIIMLIVILFLVISVTGIPVDFEITTIDGEHYHNMGILDIKDNIEDKFKLFKTGEAFKVEIKGETTGKLLLKTAKKSGNILFFGSLLALFIGIPKGIIDSRKKNNSGTLKLLQSLIPLSLPDVLTVSVVQLLAIYLFNNEISIFGLGPFPFFGDETFKHAIYPIISISILPAAYISRITANVIEDSFTKPYILAARGKGCTKFQIIKNHMMKSISYGVLSGFPTVVGIMFSSLIIVERLYHFQGIGFYLIYFYTTNLIPAYESGVAFTVFIAALAIFYYIIFMIFNILKDIILPQIKSN